MGVLGGLESGHNPMTLSDSALTLKSGYRDFVISKMIRLLTLGVRFGVDPDSVMAVLEDPQRVGCTGMTPFLLSLYIPKSKACQFYDYYLLTNFNLILKASTEPSVCSALTF